MSRTCAALASVLGDISALSFTYCETICSLLSIAAANSFWEYPAACIRLFNRLLPILKLHRVHTTPNDALLLQALLDFAKQLENADRVLCLIPCNALYADFAALHRTELEGAFVLADLPQPKAEEVLQ